MFELSFTTVNASFDDQDRRPEIARILRSLADKIESGADDVGLIFDSNGNRVGAWELHEKEWEI